MPGERLSRGMEVSGPLRGSESRSRPEASTTASRHWDRGAACSETETLTTERAGLGESEKKEEASSTLPMASSETKKAVKAVS